MVALKAVIPAGGFGTRLRPLTYTRPKPLLPIYNTTILGFILNHLSSFKLIDEVIIAANKEFKQIKSIFQDEYKGMRIKYIWEEKRLGGVACIKNASKNIREDFLVILGDNLSDVNVKEFFKFHKRKNADATIMLIKSKTPWLYGVPLLDENDYITSLIEKPKNLDLNETYIATGIYFFRENALDPIEETQFIDHTGELFPILLKHGKKVSGFKTSAYWSDIGDFKNYLEANKWVLECNQGKTASTINNVDELSYAASSSVVDFKTNVQASIILDNSIVKDDCKILNSMIYENVIIHRNSSIINSIIAENTVIEENTIVENSIIGADVLIKNNSIIRNTRIWPKIVIDVNSSIEGNIKHRYLPLK